MARPNQRRSAKTPAVMTAAAAVYPNNGKRLTAQDDRHQIAKRWQIEAYRHVNICGEARYAATTFAALAARAEIGVSEPQARGNAVSWVNAGPEVEAFAEIAPTVRDRQRLIYDYMLHRTIAGESYLIGRERRETDPEYDIRRHDPVWEIVAVTEIRRSGTKWEVRHDNGNYIPLSDDDSVIRLWSPDPEDRREAWSPFRSLLPTLKEIEWLTAHIFAQVRSRLMSAGVWFLPNNITYPPPPPGVVEDDRLAAMNDAERFMVSLAASAMGELDAEEVSFPTIVMADAAALEQVDQKRLIQFWSEIDGEAMKLRSDAIRRFALGMDLPPEQVLGSSGVAISGSGGSAGSVNHWGEWSLEEKTIAGHVEPALADLVHTLTVAFLRQAVDNTTKVIAYDPSGIRMKQDRSKEAISLYDRGLLKGKSAVRETGFDPEMDMMDDEEFKRWLLTKIAGGSATPEQVNESLRLLGVILNVDVSGNEGEAPGQPGRNEPRNTDDIEVHGPPQVQHDHSPAPYSADWTPVHAAAEVLVLRALEKAGNRLLNDGKRGKDRDRSTPLHMAHVVTSCETTPEFDFSLLSVALGGESAIRQTQIGSALRKMCERLYASGTAYTREALIETLRGL